MPVAEIPLPPYATKQSPRCRLQPVHPQLLPFPQLGPDPKPRKKSLPTLAPADKKSPPVQQKDTDAVIARARMP